MNNLTPEQYEEAREKYTDEDIDRFIDLAKKFASKPVLHTLIELVKHKLGPDSQQTKSLTKKIIKRKAYDQCQSFAIEFNETPQKLHIGLTMAPADYDSTVDIPHESYTEAVCARRAFLVNIARQYWKSFTLMYPEVVAGIRRAIPSWDGELTPASNGTSLFLTEDCPYRVSVYCWYFDETTGAAYWKKQQKK